MSAATYFQYYEYDNVLHRVTYDAKTGKLSKAEGYFKGDGFISVDEYPILREGELITEQEFKAGVVAERTGS